MENSGCSGARTYVVLMLVVSMTVYTAYRVTVSFTDTSHTGRPPHLLSHNHTSNAHSSRLSDSNDAIVLPTSELEARGGVRTYDTVENTTDNTTEQLGSVSGSAERAQCYLYSPAKCVYEHRISVSFLDLSTVHATGTPPCMMSRNYVVFTP